MPYRSDVEARERRAEALGRELSELEALGDVPARKAELARQIADVQSAIRGVRERRRSLPVLRAPPIALPCDVPWDAMAGDGPVRFCGHCAKKVHNLSAMTEREALELLAGDEAECVRYYQRPDGTLLTSDCPLGSRRRRREAASRVAGVVGLVGAAGLISVSVLGPRTMGSRDAPVHVLAVDRLVQEHPVGRLVRGEGTLVHGSVEHTSNVTTFVLESRGVVLPIRHASVVLPDTFRDAPGVVLDVMVEGELEVDGTFTAFSVLAKAPSGSRYLQTRAIRAVTHDSERELLRPVAVGAVVDE